MTATVRRGSGGPWEERYGYSRVVTVGDLAWVAGSTATVDGVVVHPSSAFEQTLTAFGVALDALRAVGFGPADVVRTRLYVVDLADADEVGRAHGTVFGEVRPAASLVQVAGLLDPDMLVEVELEACRSGMG